MSPTHTCHAEGCTVRIPRRLLMCRRHWYMVPPELRRRVWETHRLGQEAGDERPSAEWCEAADAAIAAVAAKTGRMR